MTRYHIDIFVYDPREPDAVAEAVLDALPDNAALSIGIVDDDGKPIVREGKDG